MADQEEPVYFDRNLDAQLTALRMDLRRDAEAIAHLRKTMPSLGVDTLDAIAEAISHRLVSTAYEADINRERPVQIAARIRPELVVYFGRRYDVVRTDATLRDVALAQSASVWEYRSGRNVQLGSSRIVEIRERSE